MPFIFVGMIRVCRPNLPEYGAFFWFIRKMISVFCICCIFLVRIFVRCSYVCVCFWCILGRLNMAVGKFTEGSISNHIIVMTLTSTVGLLAIFVVDLADLYFLSLLGSDEITAAIGFSSTLLFFMTSICLGCQVATGAAVARSEGQKDRALSSRLFSHSVIFTAVVSSVVSLVMWWFTEDLLAILGAKDKTLEYAVAYTQITVLSTPLLGIGMSCAASLRSLGDATRSMYTIGVGAVVNGIMDPILIFGFDLGVEGAAWASVAARFGILIMAFYALSSGHRMRLRLQKAQLLVDRKVWLAVAIPAMLTNMATPLGSSIVMKAMAPYGADAVAAVTIVGRIAPVAFALLFSLSGAIGPIVGQNAAAKQYDRVKLALKRTLMLVIGYVLFVWLVLSSSSSLIISVFAAQGLTAELIHFYTNVVVVGFLFNALLFIANAVMNNLRRAHMATVFNFARSLFGILPAVLILGPLMGAKGVMLAEAVGQVLFGILAYSYVWWFIQKESRER